MSSGRRVRALLDMFESGGGGLTSSLPSGTRSLLLMFAGLEDPEQRMSVGAVITTSDGQAVQPGHSNVEVELQFWADEARVYATPGVAFELWYGRRVGTGVVGSVIDDHEDHEPRDDQTRGH